MAGSPIYDKMVKEKGMDPYKGSIFDIPVRKATPEEKAGTAKPKAKAIASTAKLKAAPKAAPKTKAKASTTKPSRAPKAKPKEGK